jgi:hypothetical protein
MCSCDADVPEFYNADWVRARKPHRCDDCRREIAKGERYHRISGKWDGYVRSFANCWQCEFAREVLFHNSECDCPAAFGELREELNEEWRESGGYMLYGRLLVGLRNQWRSHER